MGWQIAMTIHRHVPNITDQTDTGGNVPVVSMALMMRHRLFMIACVNRLLKCPLLTDSWSSRMRALEVEKNEYYP